MGLGGDLAILSVAALIAVILVVVVGVARLIRSINGVVTTREKPPPRVDISGK